MTITGRPPRRPRTSATPAGQEFRNGDIRFPIAAERIRCDRDSGSAGDVRADLGALNAIYDVDDVEPNRSGLKPMPIRSVELNRSEDDLWSSA